MINNESVLFSFTNTLVMTESNTKRTAVRRCYPIKAKTTANNEKTSSAWSNNYRIFFFKFLVKVLYFVAAIRSCIAALRKTELQLPSTIEPFKSFISLWSLYHKSIQYSSRYSSNLVDNFFCSELRYQRKFNRQLLLACQCQPNGH